MLNFFRRNPCAFCLKTNVLQRLKNVLAQVCYSPLDQIGTNGDIWRHMTTYEDICIVPPPQRWHGGEGKNTAAHCQIRYVMKSYFIFLSNSDLIT